MYHIQNAMNNFVAPGDRGAQDLLRIRVDQNLHEAEIQPMQQGFGSSQHMDPLSEVLALLKPHSLISGGFLVPGDMAIYFPKHQGIKC
jgi:hypothetical protein